MTYTDLRSAVAYRFYVLRGGWGEIFDEATFNKICDTVTVALARRGQPGLLDVGNLYGVSSSSPEAKLLADVIVIVMDTLSPHLIPDTPVIRSVLAKIIDILIAIAREQKNQQGLSSGQFWPMIVNWGREASHL